MQWSEMQSFFSLNAFFFFFLRLWIDKIDLLWIADIRVLSPLPPPPPNCLLFLYNLYQHFFCKHLILKWALSASQRQLWRYFISEQTHFALVVCDSEWVTVALHSVFWIFNTVVTAPFQLLHGWCHTKLLPSRRTFCVHPATMHMFMVSLNLKPHT